MKSQVEVEKLQHEVKFSSVRARRAALRVLVAVSGGVLTVVIRKPIGETNSLGF